MVKLFASRGGIIAAALCPISDFRQDSINVVQFLVIASDYFFLDISMIRRVICIVKDVI